MYQTKENYIQEEYESYLDSVAPILGSIKDEYGSRAALGYVLLDGDKQPKQRNTTLVPITKQSVISKLDGSQNLPSDVKMINGRYYLVGRKIYWGKKTKKSILDLMGQKVYGYLNAIGTGEFFVVVDIDKKNINGTSLTMEDIESTLPATFVVSTPSGGKHYYYLLKKGTKAPKNMTFPCIDLLSAGKLVVAPSQYRDGHGSYSPDVSNPRFKDNLSYWNDSIVDKLTQLFNSSSSRSDSSDTHTCMVGHSRVLALNPGRSLVYQPKSGQVARETVAMVQAALKGGVRIKDGHRHDCLFYYCAKVADKTPAPELLTKAMAFNSFFMVHPLPEKQVKSLVKWCLKSFGCYNGKTQKQLEQRKMDIGKYARDLMKVIESSEKTTDFTTSMEKIVPVMQKFFEARFNKEYASALPTSVVGKILNAAGFSKKKIQSKGIRAWLWNVNLSTLTEVIDEAIASEKAALKNSTQTDQVASETPSEETTRSNVSLAKAVASSDTPSTPLYASPEPSFNSDDTWSVKNIKALETVLNNRPSITSDELESFFGL